MKECCFFWKRGSNMIRRRDGWNFIYFRYLNVISILVVRGDRCSLIGFYKFLRFNNFCCVCLRVLIRFPSRIYIICYCWRLGKILGRGITNIFRFSNIRTFFFRKYRFICFIGRFFWNRLFCSNIRRSIILARLWRTMFSWW